MIILALQVTTVVFHLHSKEISVMETHNIEIS